MDTNNRENNSPHYSQENLYSNVHEVRCPLDRIIPVVPPRRNIPSLLRSQSNINFIRNPLDQPSTPQCNRPQSLKYPIPTPRKNVNPPPRPPKKVNISPLPIEEDVEYLNAPPLPPRAPRQGNTNVVSSSDGNDEEDAVYVHILTSSEEENSEDSDFESNSSGRFGFRSDNIPPPLPQRPLSSILRDEEEIHVHEDDKDIYEVYVRETRERYVSLLHRNVRDTLDIDNMSTDSFDVDLFNKIDFGSKPNPSCIVDELKESEKSYLQKLIEFVYGFIPDLERSCSLDSQQEKICVAIKKLYDKSSKFLDKLEMCVNDEEVANAFINHQDLFQLYPSYISLLDSPPSFIKTYEKVLLVKNEHAKLQKFKCILIAPLQRLAMYRLLLQKLLKESKKSHGVTVIPHALRLIEDQLDESSKNISLRMLKDAPQRLFQNGKCLLVNTFKMTRPIMGDVSVLLFENAVVLATLNHKSSDKNFECFQDIKMQDLDVRDSIRENVLIFEDRGKNKKYEIDTLSSENFRIWRYAIQEKMFRRSLIKRQSTIKKEVPNISKPYDLRDYKVVVNVACEIKDCPFDFTGYGNLVLMNNFSRKKKKVTVFLYERIIIITTSPKEDNLSYFYKGSIEMCNITLEPANKKKPKELCIKDHSRSRMYNKDVIYKLNGDSVENVTCWRDAISKYLWQQFEEVKKNKSCSQ